MVPPASAQTFSRLNKHWMERCRLLAF